MRPDDRAWDIYFDVMAKARERGISLAVGGGIAVSSYVPQRASTKDIDLYVKPSDRDRMIEILSECGLRDYYDEHPYDRNWIYRAHDGDGTIVDIMWAMPNQRAQVDDEWLRRGPEIDVHGRTIRVLPPEELIWAKLYILQRDRCDWPDVLNVLYATAPQLDWEHLIERVGGDAPLLEAILAIFQWLCPGRAAQLPPEVRRRLKTARRGRRSAIPRDQLLDTRPWFLPRLEEEPEAC